MPDDMYFSLLAFPYDSIYFEPVTTLYNILVPVTTFFLLYISYDAVIDMLMMNFILHVH